MALIKCPECAREVSNKAITCPNCGYPIAQMIDLINTKMEVISDELARKHRVWSSMGLPEKIFPLLDNSLSKEEADNMFQNGALSSSLLTVFDAEFDGGNFEYYFEDNLRKAKVLMIIDLFVCQGKTTDSTILGYLLFMEKAAAIVAVSYVELKQYHYKYKTLDDMLFIIPYSCFNSMTIEYRQEIWTDSDIQVISSKIPKKSNLATEDAIIGALIAGPTGAIIGATIGNNNQIKNDIETQPTYKSKDVITIANIYKAIFNVQDSECTANVESDIIHNLETMGDSMLPSKYLDTKIYDGGAKGYRLNEDILLNKVYMIRDFSQDQEIIERQYIAEREDYCRTLEYAFMFAVFPDTITDEDSLCEEAILSALSDKKIKSKQEIIDSNAILSKIDKARFDALMAIMRVKGLIDTFLIREVPEIYCSLPEQGVEKLREDYLKIFYSKDKRKRYQSIVTMNAKAHFGNGAKERRNAENEIAKIDSELDSLKKEIKDILNA